jgi:CheY-like chemotaxis protein
MPDMDGIGLLEIMRNYTRWKSTPVIVVTAHASADQVRRAKVLGVANVFQKATFKLPELAAAVNEVLGAAPQ